MFACCSKNKNTITEMATQLGAGPSMFLIGMKQLMYFFIVMSIINIPIYVFLWGQASIVKADINSFFT